MLDMKSLAQLIGEENVLRLAKNGFVVVDANKYSQLMLQHQGVSPKGEIFQADCTGCSARDEKIESLRRKVDSQRGAIRKLLGSYEKILVNVSLAAIEYANTHFYPLPEESERWRNGMKVRIHGFKGNVICVENGAYLDHSLAQNRVGVITGINPKHVSPSGDMYIPVEFSIDGVKYFVYAHGNQLEPVEGDFVKEGHNDSAGDR